MFTVVLTTLLSGFPILIYIILYFIEKTFAQQRPEILRLVSGAPCTKSFRKCLGRFLNWDTGGVGCVGITLFLTVWSNDIQQKFRFSFCCLFCGELANRCWLDVGKDYCLRDLGEPTPQLPAFVLKLCGRSNAINLPFVDDLYRLYRSYHFLMVILGFLIGVIRYTTYHRKKRWLCCREAW